MNQISVNIDTNISNTIIHHFTPELLFDEKHTSSLIQNHTHDFNFTSVISYGKEWSNASWKKNCMIDIIEKFLALYGITIYYGYETCFLANQIHYGVDRECGYEKNPEPFYKFMLYTNTNMVLQVYIKLNNTYKKNSNYLIKVIGYIDNIFNHSEKQSERYQELFIFKNKGSHENDELYLIIDEKYINVDGKHRISEFSEIVNTVIEQYIHPYIYSDYLRLCHPKNTLDILSKGNGNSILEKKYDNIVMERCNLHNQLLDLHANLDSMTIMYDSANRELLQSELQRDDLVNKVEILQTDIYKKTIMIAHVLHKYVYGESVSHGNTPAKDVIKIAEESVQIADDMIRMNQEVSDTNFSLDTIHEKLLANENLELKINIKKLENRINQLYLDNNQLLFEKNNRTIMNDFENIYVRLILITAGYYVSDAIFSVLVKGYEYLFNK